MLQRMEAEREAEGKFRDRELNPTGLKGFLACRADVLNALLRCFEHRFQDTASGVIAATKLLGLKSHWPSKEHMTGV